VIPWGSDDDGRHLLKRPELGVIQERIPPRCCETRQFHERARQVFFVLAGVVAFGLDGSTYALGPGGAIELAPRFARGLRNESADDLEIMVIALPHGREHGVQTEPA
jgi:mannose-6-phosphate isomerase-like protein (cupin superfamily)